ncbi:MAG: hypothetical protein IMZ58_09580, partial [Thermoplasmata archaeon]|nr:hypothetical protein [Thermoplasmata archaeon]
MEKINRINNPRVTKEYSDNIPIQEARKSLLRSGYLLEARLENILLKNDYYVQSNYVYPDPESNKPREIDLDAILAIDIKPRKLEYIFLELIIECINNNQPLAFITKEPPFRDYQSFEIKMLGRPETISKTRNSKILLSIPEYLKMKDYHHYFKGSVATQYCTFDLKQKGPNKGEWRAYHHDDHHESLVKLCQALEYSKLDFEEEFDYRIDNS